MNIPNPVFPHIYLFMVSEKKKIFEISANLKGHGNHIEFSNGKGVRVMVLYATFKNISIISLQSVLIDGGNWSIRRKPPTCRKSHNIVSSTYHHECGSNSQL